MFKGADAFSSFSVNDLAKAKKFYGQTLGLEVEDNPMGVLQVHTANGMEIVIYPKDDHTPAVFTVLNFSVDNIDQAVDDLVSQGISIEKYEGFNQDEKGIMRDEQGPAIAWFKDPAGNTLSVVSNM